jgi:OPA family glycerol-3-phosphate transporter-like MFS transporter/OPA family sugar phosphate sensor protein UhpC-like MFS transporter
MRDAAAAAATPTPVLPYATPAVPEAYVYFRPRILLWTIVGYAMFYFVRKNLSVAMPAMEAQLGIGKSQLGLFLTLHGLLYGVSKFANGVLGDRCNARWFMVIGLLGSAILNVCFGLSSAVVWLGVFWMANGWVQGMGFPPCARLLTHWFSPRELATKMSVWNTSHSIGAGAVVILCGYLVDHFNNWRLCLFVPAAIATVAAVLLAIFLRDTPSSVGLPELEETRDANADAATVGEEKLLRRKVFANKYIWILALANFFVYTIRYSVLDWGPTLLKEAKGVTLAHAGWMVAAFEIAGVIGMLCAGWITDRVFGGRGARTCVLCMICCAGAVALFWMTPARNVLAATATLMAAGFFIYGPQALVGIAVANLATKRAAATAVGLTGIFGYASSILSGWGLGTLVEAYSWGHGFAAMLVAAGVGTLLFALAWPAPRDGYKRNVRGARLE